MKSKILYPVFIILCFSMIFGMAACSSEPAENPFPDAVKSTADIDHIDVAFTAELQSDYVVKARFTNNTADRTLYYDGTYSVDYSYKGEWYNIYSLAIEDVLLPESEALKIEPSRSDSETIDLEKILTKTPPKGHYRIVKDIQFSYGSSSSDTIAAEFDIK